MKNRTLLLCIAIIAAMVLLTALALPALPARVAIHWDAHGRANGFGAPVWLFANLAIDAVLLMLWVALPHLSPAKFAVEEFSATYWRAGLLLTIFLAAVHGMVLWTALGHTFSIAQALPAGVAIFIGLLGNMMGKLRRNFWIGIRTPWTLASERVWYATHRFAGKSMVAGAALSLTGLLAGWPLLMCLLLPAAGVVAPALYSFWAYRRFEAA